MLTQLRTFQCCPSENLIHFSSTAVCDAESDTLEVVELVHIQKMTAVFSSMAMRKERREKEKEKGETRALSRCKSMLFGKYQDQRATHYRMTRLSNSMMTMPHSVHSDSLDWLRVEVASPGNLMEGKKALILQGG
jgi:hypothetical protein